MQDLRQRLLVSESPSRLPRIGLFAGKASLLSFLRAAAVNLSRDLHRKDSPIRVAADFSRALALSRCCTGVSRLSPETLRRLLGEHRGVISRVAEALTLSRRQVRRLMEQYGLRREDFI